MTLSNNDPLLIRRGEVATLTGTVERLLSQRDDCICCDGRHVFGFAFNSDTEEQPNDLIERAKWSVPDGTRLRITIEAIGV